MAVRTRKRLGNTGEDRGGEGGGEDNRKEERGAEGRKRK
jgi:hypothetical protein